MTTAKPTTIGILGAGQLARMLALAGLPLGLRFVTLDPAPDACAAALSTRIIGDYGDREKLERFAGMVDVVTYEFENVPAESVGYLAERLPVYPSPRALAVSRDRFTEKSLFVELGIPTPKFLAVDSLDGLKSAVCDIGLPAVLKTRTLGYDGKGQSVIKSDGDIDGAWASAGGAPCVLEAFVPFTREISVVAVRGRGGEARFYPVGENTHSGGILRHTVCRLGDPMQSAAEELASRLLKRFDYVGVLALELFDVGGKLTANEMAPRVHNTGHWSIEGARTSQFENHVRAAAGLPLGGTEAVCRSAMVNFIGMMPDAAEVLSVDGAHLHDYGKAAKPGRKLGHATVCGEGGGAVAAGLERLLRLTGKGLDGQ
ncbi:MAG: 5-(carboxyamino)imidazole ribonucleotide synthase [Chitinispirillales bacterium]|jgi:5-(carboxyamino)imidazole ribonucleotide synthase|nr:5-(carboxyamino)imidazole ribonucleotide synthase [Chitinispirillales bacterium]